MAVTQTERMKILQMLQEGKVTPQDAATLLEALDASVPKSSSEAKKAQRLHIRVTDLATQKVRVNVTLPLAMAQAGLKLGSRFGSELKGLDPEILAACLAQGEACTLVDVADEVGGEHVEIYLD